MTKEKNQDKLNYKQIILITLGVIGLLGSLASIYAIMSTQKKVSLKCDIISSTNVLDINADISDVEILFKNNSLKKENKNLKLIIIKVKNDGSIDILTTFYDKQAPFGIKPIIGKIVERPEIIETSNDYLKEYLSIRLDSTGIVYFSDVIIDAKENFTFKFLTLVDIGVEPKFEIIGKIAGINKKVEIGLFEAETEMPFFKQVFLGNFIVQIVKSLIYFLSIVIIILIIGFTSESVSNRLKKMKRIKLINNFKSSAKYKYRYIDDIIFNLYKEDSSYRLLSIQEDLKDSKKLNQRYSNIVEKLETEKEKCDKLKGYTKKYYSLKDEIELIEELIADGFLLKKDNSFIINEHMKETLCQFISYAKIGKLHYGKLKRIEIINNSQQKK